MTAPDRGLLRRSIHASGYEIYKRDFNLFKYDAGNPGNKMPIGEIDLEEVHAKLGD